MIIGNTDQVFSFPVQKSIELFGITVDDRLCFDEHVSSICKNISNQFNVISRFRKLIPANVLLRLYKAVILPHFLYCSTVYRVWHVHVKELIKSFSQKLNLLRSLYFLPTTARVKFQSYFTISYLWVGCMGFLRQIALWWAGEDTCTCRKDGLDWYTPSDQVLAQSKWPTVKDLYEYRLLMLAHGCFYNFLPVPIMKLFTKYDCNYNLQRKLTFLLPKPNTEVLRKSTCFKNVSLWNSLDNHTCAISK